MVQSSLRMDIYGSTKVWEAHPTAHPKAPDPRTQHVTAHYLATVMAIKQYILVGPVSWVIIQLSHNELTIMKHIRQLVLSTVDIAIILSHLMKNR